MNKREVGTRYEQKAADYLIDNGYEILDRNFRCRTGEIDLIAKTEGYLCFIEVKYRSSTYNGFPAEAINTRKMLKIIHTAEFYMLYHKLPQTTPCRFDVVVILDHEISLIKNAFEGI
ncbi:MAG TPA: YraN family protein [Mobilitalea sp.]|nr:YraN family protein [Mobilitalea sp.]